MLPLIQTRTRVCGTGSLWDNNNKQFWILYLVDVQEEDREVEEDDDEEGQDEDDDQRSEDPY